MLTWRGADGWRNRELHLCVAEVEGIPTDECWWCGRTVGVRWVVDHVDGDVENNLPYNLVRSCSGCNLHKGSNWRGHGYMTAHEYALSGQGVHVCADRRMCEMGIGACAISE